MEDSNMHEAAMSFVGAIKQSSEYRAYAMQLEKIKRQEEVFEQVNEFRQKNFQIQTSEEAENLLDIMDELEKEYEVLSENPIVVDFLDAEAAFCRMMQEINMFIMEKIDFE